MKIYWQCVYWWDGCKIMIPGWLETSFDIFSYSLVWYFHAIMHHVVLLRMDNSLGFLLFLFFLIQSLLILFKADEFFIWSEEKPEYWADESLKFHGTSLVVQRLGFCAFIADGVGLIPGQGIKILWATQWAKNTNK